MMHGQKNIKLSNSYCTLGFHSTLGISLGSVH